MNCEDLLNIPEIRNGLRLVAGEAGVRRNIRWIYFADCVQCLEDGFDVAELIHGEELVIVTNKSLTDDDDKIIDMIRAMYNKDIAAFVINQGQISKKIMDYCNEIELPLYELSLDLHLIDLSQVVCKVLVEESAKISSLESILTSILYSENIDVADIMKQAGYLGVSLSGKHRVAVFKMYDTEMSEDSGSTIETRENVKKLIENEFRLHGLKKLLIHLQMDSIALMLPSELFSKDLIISIFGGIIKKMAQSYSINAKVGIGSDYEYIAELKNSYQEACDTIQILNTVSSLKSISFYEDLGLYSLISQIKNGKFLDDYINTKLGALIDADKMQAGELCATLKAYLECNCNANATAEVLYIHRNTMRYRLEKIKGVLGNNLNDLSACVELKLAFAIKDYREHRKE
jgi:sugar diacid utilization regulator